VRLGVQEMHEVGASAPDAVNVPDVANAEAPHHAQPARVPVVRARDGVNVPDGVNAKVLKHP
jgi:hypothetical protein